MKTLRDKCMIYSLILLLIQLLIHPLASEESKFKEKLVLLKKAYHIHSIVMLISPDGGHCST